MENNFSLADISAVLGKDGWSGGGCSWLIILFLIIAGGGYGWNRGGGDYGQYATAASQQEILFGQHFQNIDNKLDRLGNGIADATYALNNAVTGEGRALQSQMAQCCCDNQRNVDALRYDMSQQTQKILDQLSQNKIDSLTARVNELQLQAAMCGVVRYPNQLTYSAGGSPFCNCAGGCAAGV